MGFISMAQLAVQWNKQEWELCQWAANGWFRVGVFINENNLIGKNGFININGFVLIPANHMTSFISRAESSLSQFVTEEGHEILLPWESQIKMRERLYGNRGEVSSINFCRSELLIRIEEVARLKAEHPELFCQQGNEQQTEQKSDKVYRTAKEIEGAFCARGRNIQYKQIYNLIGKNGEGLIYTDDNGNSCLNESDLIDHLERWYQKKRNQKKK